jgi:hypothetical protein
VRHASRLREPEASDRVIFDQNSDSADLTPTEAEVILGKIDRNALGVSNLGSDPLGFGQVAAADQQRHLGMGSPKVLGSEPANEPGTACKEKRS